jgi:hypothetical protein
MMAAQSNHKFADTQIICTTVRMTALHFIGDFSDLQFSYLQNVCRHLLAESRL